MTCELLVVLARGRPTASRHALGATRTGKGLVARRQLRGVVDGGSVGYGLTLVRLPNCLRQHIRVYHMVGEAGGVSRRMVVAQHRVDTRRSRRRRDSEVLRSLQRDAEELPSLLLLEGAHLVLEHLALEGALTLVFHALESALLFADGQQVSLRKSQWGGDGGRDSQQTCRTYYHRVSQPGEQGTRLGYMEGKGWEKKKRVPNRRGPKKRGGSGSSRHWTDECR